MDCGGGGCSIDIDSCDADNVVLVHRKEFVLTKAGTMLIRRRSYLDPVPRIEVVVDVDVDVDVVVSASGVMT